VGYIPLSELKEIKINGWLEIDCEREDIWRIKPASAIENIRIAHGWKENTFMSKVAEARAG